MISVYTENRVPQRMQIAAEALLIRNVTYHLRIAIILKVIARIDSLKLILREEATL